MYGASYMVMTVMRGFTFHPLYIRVFFSESYLVCFCPRACSRYLSWQYVNSSVCEWEGVICVWLVSGAPITHKMYGISFARH